MTHNTRSTLLASCALLLAAFSGCTEQKTVPATQIVVEVDSNLTLGQQLTRIEARVLDPDSGALGAMRDFSLSDKPDAGTGQFTLPLSFGITRGSLSRVLIQVTGHGPLGDGNASAAVVERKVIANFVEGRSQLLQIFLDEVCLGASCPSGQTCYPATSTVASASCGDIDEATDLPFITPGDEVVAWEKMPTLTADAAIPDAAKDRDGHTATLPDTGTMMTDSSMGSMTDGSMADGSTNMPDVDGAVPCEETAYYLDMDGDGEGDPAQAVQECKRPQGYVDNGDDCDDQCATCFLGGVEVCDGNNNDCDDMTDEGTDEVCGTNDGACKEGTRRCVGGAYGSCEGEIAPVDEVCDGTLDENCDGTVDENCACSGNATRACGSGEGECVAGTQSCVGGSWASSCPGSKGPARDVCDGLDNDCDTRFDEDDPNVGTACGTNNGVCRQGSQVCQAGKLVCQGEVRPAAGDATCDDLDDDCDNKTDENVANIASKGNSCSVGAGSCARTGSYVCAANASALICGATAGTPSTWYRDADNDGYGNPSSTKQDCARPTGYVSDKTDCNDSSGISYPGANEVCDGLDNNCANGVDDTFPTLGTNCSVGVGACQRSGKTACTGPSSTGCNVSAGSAVKEVCGDNVDNDCDGQTDEGCPTGLELGSVMSCVYLSPADSAGRRPVKCWGTMSLASGSTTYSTPSLLFGDATGFVRVQPGKFYSYVATLRDGTLSVAGNVEASGLPGSALVTSGSYLAYGSSVGLFARVASGGSSTYSELRPDGSRVGVTALESGGSYLMLLEGTSNRLRILGTSGSYLATGSVTNGVNVEGAFGPSGSNFRTCVLLGDGTIACLGDFVDNELSNAAKGYSATPRIASVANQNFIDVAVTSTAACGLARSSSGQQTVYCWGRSNSSSGFSPDPDSPVSSGQADVYYGSPTRIGVASLGTDVIDIDGGSNHICALTRDGRVFCWGSNSNSQTGTSFPLTF